MQIKYAISAVFDIDVGATIKACTPAQPDEPLFQGSLAQLLIPDGAHQHSEDWTFFSLWKEPGDNQKLSYVPISDASEPFYVCNFVKTVFSPDIRRGSRIVTLAVVTPEPSYSCLKSLISMLLVRQLEIQSDKFDPQLLTDKLYNVVKGIDDSTVPRYSYYEKRVLDTHIATLGEFTVLDGQEKQPPQIGPLSMSPFGASSLRAATPSTEVLGPLESTPSPSTPKESTESTPCPDDSVEEYVPIDLDRLEEADLDGESGQSDSSDSKQTSESEELSSSVVESRAIADKHFERLVVEVDMLDRPILVPVPTFSDSYNSGAFSVTRALRSLTTRYKIKGNDKSLLPFGAQTPALTVFWLAMMSGRRVLVYQDASSISCTRLCELVLAYGYLSSAQGLVNTYRRTFPIVDLSMVEELQDFSANEGGFLAGTTNEAFALHPDWWDVLIRPDAKTVTLSCKKPASLVSRLPFPRTRKAVNRIKLNTRREDIEFYRKVVKLAKEWYNETKIRQLCNRQFQMLIRLAASEKTIAFPHQTVADKTYSAAVNEWHSQKSSKSYYSQLKSELKYEILIRDLLTLPADCTGIYAAIDEATHSTNDVAQMLLVPDSTYYISLGVFHRSMALRKSATHILDTIERQTLGEAFIAKLPPIHKLGRKRAKLLS